MKSLFILMIAMLSFSAFAGSIKLREIDATEYESIGISYDVSHGAVIWIDARRFDGIPGHPETYVDNYMVNSSAISFIRGNFIVTIKGEQTICAKLVGDEMIETGACSVESVLDPVNDVVVVSLITK